MSASRDNLPAVEEPDLSPVIEERTRKTLADVRWLLVLGVGSIVAVFGSGWAAFAQVRTEAHEVAQSTAKGETAGIRTEQEAQKRTLADVGAELSATKGEVRELKDEVKGLRADLRVLFPTLPKVPKDGGP